MNRKAILIESSKVKDHNELPGARLDIENWEHYLKSDLGGAWSVTEILKMSHPLSSEVEREINAVSGFDYVFIAFSGHGCEGSVVLNDYLTSFDTNKMKPKSRKGTLIIDSCRGVSDGRAYQIRAKQAFANVALDEAFVVNSLAGRATELSAASFKDMPISHRTAWETSLKSSGIGVVSMLSCSKGQSAGEDPNAGGFYTSLLLQGSADWSHGNVGIFTTRDAHDYAKGKLPQQQTPEYSPSSLTFPFGVSV